MPPDAIIPPPLSAVRAALFDLDGTLARTFIDFPAMRRAMRGLSEKYGTTSATEGEDDILGIVSRMTDALGERGHAARREAYALLEAMERDGCACPEPVPGAAELLRRLKAERGLPVAIITRNCRAVSEDLLARLDLPHDLLISRDDVREFKPRPEPILRACREMGVSPSDCVMTGDLWTDIAAGRAAKVRATIGIQWPHDPPERFARCRPDYEVASLCEAALLFFLD